MTHKFYRQILGDAFDAGIKAETERKNEVRAWDDFEDWFESYKFKLNPQYELCDKGTHWFRDYFVDGKRTHNICGFCGATEENCKELCQYNNNGSCNKIGNCIKIKVLK